MGTVLVIDDQLELRTLFRRALQPSGHSIALTCNGEEAIRLAETTTPDVILLDQAMPQMDGLAFLRAARTRPALAHVPVIMLTGLMSPEQVAAAREMGVSDLLIKGEFSMRELRTRVEKYLPPSVHRATHAA